MNRECSCGMNITTLLQHNPSSKLNCTKDCIWCEGRTLFLWLPPSTRDLWQDDLNCMHSSILVSNQVLNMFSSKVHTWSGKSCAFVSRLWDVACTHTHTHARGYAYIHTHICLSTPSNCIGHIRAILFKAVNNSVDIKYPQKFPYKCQAWLEPNKTTFLLNFNRFQQGDI